MLDMRRREEADGESRIMGSIRRLCVGFGREATGVIEEGTVEGGLLLVFVEGLVPLAMGLVGRLRLMKGSVNLWTWEKSCIDGVSEPWA